MPTSHRATSRLFRIVVAAAAGGLLVAAIAEAGSPFVGRKDRQARDTLESGDLEGALASYQEILSSDIKDSRRQEALYNVALIYLQPAFEHRDLAGARAALEELYSAGVGEQGPETRALLALLAELEQTRRRQDETRRQLEEKEERLDRAADEEDDELADQRGTIEELRRKVRALQTQLDLKEQVIAETEAELARKDAALKRVTQTLVGSSGSGD